MTRRWSLVLAATLAFALVVIAGTLALRPLFSDGDRPGGGPSPSATSTPPPPPPAWESTDLPGFSEDPGPFTAAQVDPEATGAVSARLSIADDAMRTGGTFGLSFDATELANPAWNSPTSNLALTLRELDRPVLRFGGNGVDRRMWWTSSAEPAPQWAEATVTPDDLRRVAAVADDLDAEVTIVLDLGHDDPERAADMASHARKAFGDRLLAVTIGNEPNGYFHPNQPHLAVRGEEWGPEAYQDSLEDYSATLEQAVPGLPVAGPGAYDAPWWRAFAETDIPGQRALSMHWYPLWDCAGPDSSIANPTIEDLTSPALRERAGHIVGMGAEIAAEHELPLWMEETGPTSCPGTNETSRTHAQALWTVDYAMTLLELGVERAAFHATLQACQGGAPMSPVCATGSLEDPGQIFAGRGSYLALMLLGWLPEGTVLTPSASGDGRIMVHGVLADDGAVSLVIVDLRDPEASDSPAVPVHVELPDAGSGQGATQWRLVSGGRLSGESLRGHDSRLTAPAPVAGATAQPAPGSDQLSVSTEPGTATLLTFTPGGAAPAPEFETPS